VQVAYTFGRKQIVGWQFCTPVSAHETRVFVHVTWSAGPMTGLLGFVIPLLGRVIMEQDREILDHQGEQRERFGEQAAFCSTAADTANLWIAGSRRRAAAGEPQASSHAKRVTFRV
jgi:hypothetical protein